jgi:alanine transaminase
LNEDKQWGLDTAELQRALKAAHGQCQPRAIVVINPGNPTGQVLTRKNIEEVIEFAYEEGLFILADEVCEWSAWSGFRQQRLSRFSSYITSFEP